MHGANYRGPKTFRTKADALAYLSTVEADVLRGSWIDPELTETRFQVVAEEWLRSNVNKRDSSLQRDLGILENHVLPVFGNRAIGSIRPANVQSLVDTWASTYSANTTQRHYATLRSIFSFAEASEIILRSPCRGIRLPKIRQTERPVLTTAELLSLADALGLVDGLFMWCGAALGLRWSEIAGLTVDRMDFAARTATVDRQIRRDGTFALPKSDAGRRLLSCPVWLSDDLEELSEDLGKTDEDLIFSTDSGSPLDYTNWRPRIWIPACNEAGLEGLRFHDLRSMAATALVASGADIKTAQRRLGHSSSRMTLDIYARATGDADRAAADAVGRFLRPDR